MARIQPRLKITPLQQVEIFLPVNEGTRKNVKGFLNEIYDKVGDFSRSRRSDPWMPAIRKLAHASKRNSPTFVPTSTYLSFIGMWTPDNSSVPVEEPTVLIKIGLDPSKEKQKDVYRVLHKLHRRIIGRRFKKDLRETQSWIVVWPANRIW
jgi:hypothetical protein